MRQKAPLARDLGLLDQRERLLTDELLDPDGQRPEARMPDHLLRASRRAEVSATTMRNIQRLSREKQIKLETMACKYLPPWEYDLFKRNTKGWFNSPVRVKLVVLKLGFGKLRHIQHRALEALRGEI